MSDLIDEPREGLNEPEFSVSEISGAIKRAIESGFSHVRIRGEVGRVSMPRSGHIYLDLKDDKSVISAVVWKGVAGRLATHPEEGLEVVATGRITTFGGQSKYQLVIEDMKPAGVGALMAMLEKRKAALQAEGLFDPALKVDLPYLPEVIGVITSPSGAVIRDILHRLRDRFPRKVLIWPVAVQGKNCAPEVTRAIEGFNAMSLGGALPRPDLLIVARGGGSLEDLWGFNEENVARAAAASQIPLISAVGHETDTTLIDFVSDVRAPTPTAAAELAVPVRHELLASVAASEARMAQSVSNLLTMRQQRLRDLGRALPRPDTLLDGPQQKLDLWGDRLPAGLIKLVQGYRLRVSEWAGSLRPASLRRAVIAEDKRLQALAPRLAPGLIRVVGAKREALGHRSDRLNVTPLQQDMVRKLKELSRLAGRLSDAGARQIGNWKEQIAALDRLRETLGYKATLRRGYAVVHGDGAVVTSKKSASAATKLEVEFADGRLQLSGRPVRRGAAPDPETGTADQGDLF
jgi:exodeoxyribonuclease VII large subunit